jgi:hypothetical protein
MIYIGNLLYLSNQQSVSEDERRHGEFNLIVEAESNEAALVMFRDRIVELRESSDLFEGDCRLFFNQLLEFDRISGMEATMVNFKSVAGDPTMPYIGCTLPTEIANDCRIFDWDDHQPEIDGKKGNAFLEFRD